MDDLVKLAVIGVSRQSSAMTTAAHPADEAVPAGGPSDLAQEVLWKAGCRAIYRQAGRIAISIPTLPKAPEVSTATGSPRIVSALQSLLAADSRDILLELVQLLRSAGSSIPHELLPTALNVQDPDLREILHPVLGSRGVWLSQFNPAWSWVTQNLTDLASGETSRYKQIWDEGDLAERCRVLARVRQSNPQLGRDWLSEGFNKEKPPHRAKFLEAFQEGLSIDDAPFLENSLKDRSEAVRTTAHDLLCQLPESHHALRVWELGQTLLTPIPHDSGLRVECSFHDDLPNVWEKLTGGKKAPPGAGPKAFLVQSILAVIPPTRWSDKFHSSPQQIFAGLSQEPFREAILAGLTVAQLRFTSRIACSQQWTETLWGYWTEQTGLVRGDAQANCYDRLAELLELFNADEAEHKALQIFETLAAQSDAVAVRFRLITSLPRPWSAGFTRQFMTLTRSLLANRSDALAVQWSGLLPVVARCLSPECFLEVGQSWKLAEGKGHNWQQTHIERELERFFEQVRLRHALYQELRPS